jgi:hypothetical protein
LPAGTLSFFFALFTVLRTGLGRRFTRWTMPGEAPAQFAFWRPPPQEILKEQMTGSPVFVKITKIRRPGQGLYPYPPLDMLFQSDI